MKSTERVKEFHEVFGLRLVDKPTNYEVETEDEERYLDRAIFTLLKLELELKEAAAKTKNPLFNRMRLIVGETKELFEAVEEGDLEHILHEQEDCQYVLDGFKVEVGLDTVADEANGRIHAANMSKLDVDGTVIRDEGGKVVKGPNFRPATMKGLV